MPNTGDWDIGDYAAGTTYSINEIVLDSSIYYVSLQDSNTGNTPASKPLYWRPSTLKSIWLKRKIYGTIETVLSKTVRTTPLIDHELLYNITDTSTTVTSASKYVGFEIRPKNSEHLQVIINRISSQFSEANTGLTMYLYNQNALVSSFTIDSLSKSFQWNDITDIEINGQARWFLYYDQDDLTGEAYDWDFYSGTVVSAFVDIFPFEVPNTTTNFLADVSGYTNSSYGLGLDLTVNSELTQFLTSNRNTFGEVLQLQWQYDILSLFMFNAENRSNSTERNILKTAEEKNIVLGETTSENENTVVMRLSKEIKQVQEALKFGDVCLPCNNETTIIYNTNFG